MPSKYFFFDDYHFIYCFNEVSFVVVDLNYIYLCVCSHMLCTVQEDRYLESIPSFHCVSLGTKLR